MYSPMTLKQTAITIHVQTETKGIFSLHVELHFAQANRQLDI